MKENIFIDMTGVLKDYAPLIFREERTKDRDLMRLHTNLNLEIKKWQNEDASEMNCRLLWNNLTQIFRDNPVVKTDDNTRAYEEIVGQLKVIGNNIAYFNRRNVDIIIPSYYKTEFCQAVDKSINFLAEGTIPQVVLESFRKWVIAKWSAEPDRKLGSEQIRKYANADERTWRLRCMETICEYWDNED